jgi:hypothetical protein
MKGECALCLEEKELQLSHIIPKFVFNYLKESAPGGLRSYRTPNLRIQDGEKEYLLCRDCEQLFSSWEKPFSEHIFVPLHDPSPVTTPIVYKQWALKFAASVSWRVLNYYMKLGLSHFSDEQKAHAQQALNFWREFLLGGQKHPGRFEQHLLPLDVIEHHTVGEISPFLNRYLLRSIHMDVLVSESSAIVYTKLCRVTIFGFIYEANPLGWQGMKLHVNKGTIRPRDYLLPGEIFKYINDKASQVKEALNSLSPKQEQKVAKVIAENLDEIANSEIYRAMSYDVAHSGKAAFKHERGVGDGAEKV